MPKFVPHRKHYESTRLGAKSLNYKTRPNTVIIVTLTFAQLQYLRIMDYIRRCVTRLWVVNAIGYLIGSIVQTAIAGYYGDHRKGTRPPRFEQTSRLLQLPPELRNAIYEFVLIEPGSIVLTSAFRPPPLLSACTTTRHEARKIFYEHNVFKLPIDNLDYTLYRKWEILQQVQEVEATTWLKIHECFDWDKVVAWCRYVWSDAADLTFIPLHDTDYPGVRYPMWTVVGSLHEVSKHYRTRPWKECLEALIRHRTALGVYEPRWRAK